MPHLVLEYSANLRGAFSPIILMAQTNAVLIQSGEFENPDHIKTRLVALQEYRIGTADVGEAFIHARLHLLSGRSVDTKKALCAALAECLRTGLAPLAGVRVQITAEAVDMQRESYAKTIIEPTN